MAYLSDLMYRSNKNYKHEPNYTAGGIQMNLTDKTQTKILQVILLFTFIFLLFHQTVLHAQSLDIPSKKWGISFGNSRRFTGLRFNFRDSRVDKITGINITLWQPKQDNEWSRVEGISLGLIPGAGHLRGLQIGALGIMAIEDAKGINIGGLGIGSGGDMTGINIGGLGAGSGGDMKGLNIGGLGMGAGGNLEGINIGGLGVGAGEDMKGLNIGVLGIGAGRDLYGINIGGLGAGAGENMAGLNFGVLGLGAGNNLVGITIAGFGAGAGGELKGLTICGFGAGAPAVKGITIAGFGVGGEHINGITMALGTILIQDDGEVKGFGASGFNYIKGTQNGLFIAVVNYAYHLKGVQIGLINIARNNPKGLKILPVFNAHF